MGACCAGPAALQDEIPGATVKVFGMPPSQNACGPILLAMDAGAGAFAMCNIMEGEQMKPEFLAMNPFHHIPTLKDGNLAIGESNAQLRYLALKYKPEYYPVDNPALCGMLDFAVESFASDVYEKIAYGVIYPVMGFAGPKEDQAKANSEATEVVDTWVKHFVKGKFVNDNKLSIADFKAAPFFWALMQPAVEQKSGFKLSDRAKQYTEDFMSMVASSAFLSSAGGYSIAEFCSSKMPDAGPPSEFTKVAVEAAPPLGTPSGKVKIHGMPMSSNACSPILLAMEAGVGGFEMCNLMEGAHMTPEFLAMNPFHHIPTLQDGDFVIGESNAQLRYLAIKYKPEYYPVNDPATCAMIDFACDSFSTEVYKKIAYGVFYPVFGFAGAPEDQAKSNEEAAAVLDTWMKHFVKGKFVLGDKLCIADFKAVPFIIPLMQPAIEGKTGFKISAEAKEYADRFCAAVKASEFMKSFNGFSLVEYAASKA